jgi:hypothetical protein
LLGRIFRAGNRPEWTAQHLVLLFPDSRTSLLDPVRPIRQQGGVSGRPRRKVRQSPYPWHQSNRRGWTRSHRRLLSQSYGWIEKENRSWKQQPVLVKTLTTPTKRLAPSPRRVLVRIKTFLCLIESQSSDSTFVSTITEDSCHSGSRGSSSVCWCASDGTMANVLMASSFIVTC